MEHIAVPDGKNQTESRPLIETPNCYRFSLLMATIGRVGEVDRFIAAFNKEDVPPCQLIVVDQNCDARLSNVLRRVNPKHCLQWIKSAPGLSRARNTGLSYATGDIIGFPDDDCWYSPGLLGEIDRWFLENPSYAFLVVGVRDQNKLQSPAATRIRAGRLTYLTSLQVAVSVATFVRREHCGRPFDEVLGAGSGTPFSSAEDINYVLQLLVMGKLGWFEPSMTVFHPDGSLLSGSVRISKVFHYGAGLGYVVAGYSIPIEAKLRCLVINPVAGVLLAAARVRLHGVAAYIVSCAGRLYGYMHRRLQTKYSSHK